VTEEIMLQMNIVV